MYKSYVYNILRSLGGRSPTGCEQLDAVLSVRSSPDQLPKQLGWLLVAEPDVRSRLYHHDTKILLGLTVCLLGPVIWFLVPAIH